MTKQTKHELIRLVERAMRDVGRFDERGVWLCVDELAATGHPVERIRVWATLHFLPTGSPFDSDDPDLWVYPIRGDAAEWLRREMGLAQPITLEWAAVTGRYHPGIEFVGNGGHRV